VATDASDATSAPPAADGAPPSNRKRALTVVAIVIIVIAVLLALYWIIFVRGHVDTDNAYVGGNMVQVTAQTGGTVVAVHADDTDHVQAGAPLVELDPVDARVALERAESALGRAVREVRGSFASTAGFGAAVKARQADINRARTDLARAQQDLARREALRAEGGVSGEELAHAQDAVSNARLALASATAGLNEADQTLAANQARIDGSAIQSNPTVRQAVADYKDAYIALRRATVLAPVSGIVARKNVQIGARVPAGAILMTIVPPGEMWVDANFKEAQLGDVRIGQAATLHSDLYGGSVTYHGRVVGFAAGTGSAFSLLPAQNATGNWIKVVQRVPVRIALDPRELEAHPLRIGLSMTAAVDTGAPEGAAAQKPPAAPVYRTDVYAGLDKEAEQHAQEVIAANLAPQAASANAQ